MQSANTPSNPVNDPPRPSGSGSGLLSATSPEFVFTSHPQQQSEFNGIGQLVLFDKNQRNVQGQVGHDSETIQQLHARIAQLEELVEKQRLTIVNQSRTIAHPRSARPQHQQQQQPVGYPVTPHRHAGPGRMPSSSPSVYETPYSLRTQPVGPGLYMQSPPKFEIPRVMNNGVQGGMLNSSGSPPGQVQPFGGEKVGYMTASAAPTMPAVAPVSAPVPVPAVAPASIPASIPAVTPMPAPVFAPAVASASTTSSAVVPIATPAPHLPPNGPLGPEMYFDHEKYTAELVARFHRLWMRTEAFGREHANMPNPYKDSVLDKSVKDYLVKVSDKVGASSFLPDCTARYLLVAKAVNFYLVNDVLKISAVARGFDASVDAEIERIKQQLYRETPEAVRQPLIIAMASQLYQVKKNASFAEFCQGRVHHHMDKLWQFIRPLTTDGSNKIYRELTTILSDAQILAIDMYSVPFEYRLEFAENDESFNPTTMVNRDPVLTGDPIVLRNSDARVRLGVIPLIRIRSNAAMTTEIKLAYMGHVLLRPQRRICKFTSAVFTDDGLVLS